VAHEFWLLSTHDRSRYMVLQPHSYAFHVFDSCGILVCGFSHSMNTCEPNMRFHLFDGLLDYFSCGMR
jgi:hypothetical protein